MVRENGKSWTDAMAEAGYATEFFRWFSEEAVRIPGEYGLSPAGDKRIFVTHQPIGVSRRGTSRPRWRPASSRRRSPRDAPRF